MQVHPVFAAGLDMLDSETLAQRLRQMIDRPWRDMIQRVDTCSDIWNLRVGKKLSQAARALAAAVQILEFCFNSSRGTQLG
jgi:hypothetical protein